MVSAERARRATAEKFTPDPALSFWPTPAEVADELVYLLLAPWLALGEGIRVLEPSAGAGHLVRAVRAHLPEAHITAVEPSSARAEGLRVLARTPAPANMSPAQQEMWSAWLRPHSILDEVVQGTLENYLADMAAQSFGQWTPFDVVVMNPPFTLEGRPEAWAEHVLAIYNDPHLLAPHALLGAIVPNVVLAGTRSRKVRAVRDLVAAHSARAPVWTPRGAFSGVGARVWPVMIWLQKLG